MLPMTNVGGYSVLQMAVSDNTGHTIKGVHENEVEPNIKETSCYDSA